MLLGAGITRLWINHISGETWYPLTVLFSTVPRLLLL
jgi:hypothetical protein